MSDAAAKDGREGGLEAPTRHAIPWQDPAWLDADAIDAELRRVFDRCPGCRRCLNLRHRLPTPSHAPRRTRHGGTGPRHSACPWVSAREHPGTSTISVVVSVIFLGWQSSVRYASLGSGTFTTACRGPGEAYGSTATPVIAENTVDMPDCGNPMSATFIRPIREFVQQPECTLDKFRGEFASETESDRRFRRLLLRLHGLGRQGRGAV